MGLPFADAFDLGGVQRIDLGTALALVLEADPDGDRAQRCEQGVERLVAVDFAVDVAQQPSRVRRNLRVRLARLDW